MDYLKLIRLDDLLFLLIILFTSFFVSTQSFALQFMYLPASIAAAFIIGGGEAINDFYDSEIDKINKPHRPIPSGRISKKHAFFFSLTLFIIAIVIAAIFLNLYATLIVIFWAFFLVLYAKYSKKVSVFKTLMITLFVFLGWVFGVIIASEITLPLIILGTAVSLAVFSRELYKDLEDVEGDKAMDSKTLPLHVGEKNTKYISAFSFIVALILSIYFLYNNAYSIFSYILVILATIIFLYALIQKPQKAEIPMKIAGLFFIAAFLLGIGVI